MSTAADNRFYREPPVQDIVNEAFERGQRLERERCIKLICPHCASGNSVDRNGEHILETIEGLSAEAMEYINSKVDSETSSIIRELVEKSTI